MTLIAKPASYVPATMDSHFTWTESEPQSTLSVSPTLVNAEAGDYVLHFKVCLTDYSSRCAEFDSKVYITNCVVTSVKVVSTPGDLDLSAQSKGLLALTNFEYQLTTKQTPNCNYPSSNWEIRSGLP